MKIYCEKQLKKNHRTFISLPINFCRFTVFYATFSIVKMLQKCG
ncbi:hypothetical protein HifGL_000548 [Haemophilus influenzae KR494]|nr:hypothetical protein HifGL_000548 [Haemophilus influenzae KR494]